MRVHNLPHKISLQSKSTKLLLLLPLLLPLGLPL